MRIHGITWLVAFACFISWAAFATRPTGAWQLASIASSVGALVLLLGLVAQGAMKWRERGIVNVISCLLVVAALPSGTAAGRIARSLQLSRDLERYNAAVQCVLTHSTPDTTNRIPLPSRYADLGSGVYYEHDERCGTHVDFLWAGAFPVKHVIRRYASNPEWTTIKQCHKDWARITPVSPNWYEMSD